MNARSTLTLLAGAVAATFVAGASAVMLSPDRTGQVLLFPYYTTRAGFTTSFAIVNQNMHHTKVVKVRWREGKIGAPVLDVNVFLPPRDVWTAVVSDDGSGARLATQDRSCTLPAVPAEGLPFVNGFYTGQAPGTFDDGGGAGLDRTREGYVEVIEMGVVANGADFASSPATPQGNTVASAVRQSSAGTPVNCSAVRVANPFPGGGDLRSPTGGLSGQEIIVNASNGTEFAVDPTALQHFFRSADPAADLYGDPGSLFPDLASVTPARSDVVVTDDASVEASPAVLTVNDWVAAGGQPIDAVSAVLMKNAVEGQYDVSAGLRSDVIVTMPTKRHHVLVGPTATVPTGFGPAPFAEVWRPLTHPRSCDLFHFASMSREGAPYAVVGGPSFPTPPFMPPDATLSVCGAATAITVVPNDATITAAAIFASAVNAALSLPANGANGTAPQYGAGWLFLGPTDSNAVEAEGHKGQEFATGVNAVTGIPLVARTATDRQGLRGLSPVHADGIARRYRGLPMIGFVATNALVLGQGYGGIFPLRWQTYVQP